MLRAEHVRVIGGPTGPALGPTGSAGPLGTTVIGPTGIIGATGLLGKTGYAGPGGIFTALAGLTGRTGPIGSTGYPGPDGHAGRDSLVPNADYIFNGINRDGFGPFSGAAFVGCNFRYTMKNDGTTGGYLFVFFTAQFEDTAGVPTQFHVSALVGAGTPPGPGSSTNGTYSAAPNFRSDINYTIIKPGGTGLKIPVFCFLMARPGPRSNYTEGYFPKEYWCDLEAKSVVPNNANGSYVTGGKLTNIIATIFEVPM